MVNRFSTGMSAIVMMAFVMVLGFNIPAEAGGKKFKMNFIPKPGSTVTFDEAKLKIKEKGKIQLEIEAISGTVPGTSDPITPGDTGELSLTLKKNDESEVTQTFPLTVEGEVEVGDSNEVEPELEVDLRTSLAEFFGEADPLAAGDVIEFVGVGVTMNGEMITIPGVVFVPEEEDDDEEEETGAEE